MQQLDLHLVLRSYFVGYSLTTVDIIVWGALRGNKVALSSLRKVNNNLSRWFHFIEATNPWLDAVAESGSSAAKKKATASTATANREFSLDDSSSGTVVTRFPPEPSGYLHIGHAKAALLNDHFAHSAKNGELICRFDDTNPSKESSEFEEAIIEDLALLGVVPDRFSHSSDYFQQMYDYCLKLIREGNAYADDTDRATMNDQRFNGLPSRRRDASVEDNVAHFEEMKSGSEAGTPWCIRARISVDNPNKALRDPVIFRCNLQPHHRTGDAWKVYPTYDFCVPVLDSIEGVTHALRTSEFRDRDAQYNWVQEALGLRKVVLRDFSRLNFVRTLLSKRKLAKLIEQGVVSGWDDPRMPTIRGMRRRGLTIPALREFIVKQGPSRNIVNLDWTLFWATNKKHIDPIAPRHTAVLRDGLVEATVSGAAEEPYREPRPKHGKNPDLGSKTVVYSKRILLDQEDARSFQTDEEVTLMNWGNAFVRSIHKEASSGTITGMELELHMQGDVKKTEKKITWLSKDGQDLVPVELVEFDHLITKDKLEKEDDYEQYLTPQSEFRTAAWADCNVAELKQDDIIQFERKGYYRVDKPFQQGKSAVMFNIPSGRAKGL
jgi:glutamyl-tRNA synthetase